MSANSANDYLLGKQHAGLAILNWGNAKKLVGIGNVDVKHDDMD
jgi:hypothetical protein